MSKVFEDFVGSVNEVFSDTGMSGAGGRYWGNAGSGMLFTTGKSILLLKRSAMVEQPRTWGIPGGAIPEDNGELMDAYASAKKECKEEIGVLPPHKVITKFIFKDRDFMFTTFICKVKEFSPTRLNWENDEWEWVSEEELSTYKLHFGVSLLLKSKQRNLFTEATMTEKFRVRSADHPDQTEGPAFKRWFGKSKVVEWDESPQVVYHGTSAKFSKFDGSLAGSRSQPESAIQGFYFTDSYRTAKVWGPIVKEAYLKIENPLFVGGRIDAMDEEKAKASGHDGIIQRGGKEFVVFKPTQIRPAGGKNE